MASATTSAVQSISCTAGCSLAPTPTIGAPESSSVTWSTTSGGIAWANGNWDVTLPVVAGDQFTAVTASGVQDTSGCNVIVNLKSSISGSLGNNSSSGSGAAGQTVAVSLSAPHVVQASETVWVQLIPLCGGALPHVNTLNSTIGTLSVTAPTPSHDPTLSIHGSAFQAPGASYTFAQGMNFGDVGGGTAFAPIVLPVGDQILAVRVFIRDSAVSPTHLTARLASLTSTGSVAVIASSPASLGNQTNQTLTITPPVTTIANRTGYTIAVSSDNSDSSDIFGAEVDYQ